MMLWLMFFRPHTECRVTSLRAILLRNSYKNLNSVKYCISALEDCWQICSQLQGKHCLPNAGPMDNQAS